MAPTNFHLVGPIVEAVEIIGEKPLIKTPTERPGAQNYNTIYKKLATKGNLLPKTHEKPRTEKNQEDTKLWKKHPRKPIRRKGL